MHPATRFVAVSQARPDEGKCLQSLYGCLKVNTDVFCFPIVLLSQNVGSSSVFHGHNSCESSDMNTSPTDEQQQQQQQQHSLHHPVPQHHSHHSSAKYNTTGSDNGGGGQNGHDTLSDFVTFVCQENPSGASQGHEPPDMSRSSKSSASAQYSQYSTMLPPPPLPPMARPVAIIRSPGDLSMVGGSAPSSNQMTPPQSMASPGGGHHSSEQENMSTNTDMNQSPPPLSPQSQMDISRKPLTRIPSPYSISREYASFNHFQAQPTQVSSYMLIYENVLIILQMLHVSINIISSYLAILVQYQQCLA